MLLCYRYRHSDRSIFGLVLDRRERSEVFINILKTLDIENSLPLLPALALAHFDLHVNICTLGSLENTYYFNKMLDRVAYAIGAGDQNRGAFPGLLKLLSLTFNGCYSVVGSLNVSMSAVLALTRLIREMDLDKQFSDVVDAIDSETQGHVEAAARTQARIGQRHSVFTTAMQIATALQAQEASTKEAQVLVATQAASNASVETLGAMQELLAGTQDLNRQTKEVTHTTYEYGNLVLWITFATFLVGWLSTCAVGFVFSRTDLRFGLADTILGDLLNDPLGATVQPNPNGTHQRRQYCILPCASESNQETCGEEVERGNRKAICSKLIRHALVIERAASHDYFVATL